MPAREFARILRLIFLGCAFLSNASDAFNINGCGLNERIDGDVGAACDMQLTMIAQNFPRPRPPTLEGNLRHPSTFRSPPPGSGAMDNLPHPVVVGIAGGSASGKTTFARRIVQQLGEEHVSFIGHDNYYKDLSHLTIEERKEVNFDHPDALETELLVRHLCQLKARQSVELPVYDFNTHTRSMDTLTVQPSRIIIVDGILIFAEPQLLPLMDMKIFVDTEDDLRLIRRLERDIEERGRTVDSVIEQYRRTVRPMHQLYVEPSKRGADIIVPTGPGESRQVALDMCVSHLREIINLHR